MTFRRLISLLIAMIMVIATLAVPSMAASADLLKKVDVKNNVKRNINFDEDWTFRQVDAKTPQKAVKVTLPHDAMLAGGRSAESPGNGAVAFFNPGKYEYVKTFNVPKEWKGKHITIHFDGVYRDATVYLNGKEAAFHAYGYTPFTVNCDSYLKYGAPNTIKVVADNSKMPNSRWYSGAGIYRDVTINVVNKQHIAENGVQVTTQTISPAQVKINTKVENPDKANVVIDILDHGKVIASGNGTTAFISVPNAKLWSDTNPYLYTARVRLMKNNEVIDEVEENFGIRSLSWNTKGFFVNGKNTLLRGGCVHPDNGILGAVTVKEAEERKIKIMKENGFNAVRMAHNPASQALLNACDKYGMYVMDEAFDMWYKNKNKYDYAKDFDEWHSKDIASMVSRDFNHPSVIMYSIGNEVSEPAKDKGLKVGQEMIDQIHRADPTRAVTAGLNLLLLTGGKVDFSVFDLQNSGSSTQSSNSSSMDTSGAFNLAANTVGPGMNKMAGLKIVDQISSPIADKLDIVGYNYGSGRYSKDAKDHPNRIICGSETFPGDIYDNWKAAEEQPYNIGDFQWTGWDYLGEAALGSWTYDGTNMASVKYPWLLSESGAIDILGYPGAEAAYNLTVWHLSDKPYIGVRPANHQGQNLSKAIWRNTNAIDSWSWRNCSGNDATVEVYSDKGATAELFVNGKSVGKQNLEKDKAIFETKYAPGTLKAVIYDKNGNVVGENELKSATGTIRVVPKAEISSAKPGEIAFIDVNLLGDNGVVESNADRKLKVTVENGELLGFGSANPNTPDSFLTGTYSTYYGRALAAVRCGKSGKVTFHVTDTTTGQTQTITIPVK